MYIVVVSVVEFVVKICQRVTKKERERERNRLHPRRRPLLADSANLKGAQSISTGAQYTTVQTKNWMMKSQNMTIWLLQKSFGPESLHSLL